MDDEFKRAHPSAYARAVSLAKETGSAVAIVRRGVSGFDLCLGIPDERAELVVKPE
jgi:hypothetical protein